MLIAQQKKKENIAEYLIYMWQVEDIIRAFQLDMEQIRQFIIDKYEVDEDTKNAIYTWYNELIDMMRIEGVKEKGHLQINRNVLAQLEELSHELLQSRKELNYQQLFFKASQDLAEMGKKSNISLEKPIEIAFNFLYGVLTMRLKKQEISQATLDSQKRVQELIAALAYKFHHPPKDDE